MFFHKGAWNTKDLSFMLNCMESIVAKWWKTSRVYYMSKQGLQIIKAMKNIRSLGFLVPWLFIFSIPSCISVHLSGTEIRWRNLWAGIIKKRHLILLPRFDRVPSRKFQIPNFFLAPPGTESSQETKTLRIIDCHLKTDRDLMNTKNVT